VFRQQWRLDFYVTRPSYSDEFLFTEEGSGDYVRDGDYYYYYIMIIFIIIIIIILLADYRSRYSD
jgi:hypothetical protein